MADRFPLIVNAVSQKIEELVSGDNLDLTGNAISISGDTGATKYLTSDGVSVFWGEPGNVYLTQTQSLTNKTFEQCTISGTNNTLSNIANTALVNSSININGQPVSLGGSAVTPNDDTTYTISAGDGGSATEKILTLSSSAGINDSVTFAVGTPVSVPAGSNALSLEISRQGNSIVFAGTVVDTDTVTTIQSSSGGSPQSGAITIAAGNFTTVTQSGTTITIDGENTDTITQLRATIGQTLAPGKFTFLSSGASSVAQGIDGNGDATITYSSVDTVTRLRGGTTGTYTPATSSGADITITGGSGGNVTVGQSSNTITIDSQNDDTITRLATGTGNTLSAGDFRIVQSGATTVSQSTSAGVTTITISSANDDTGASFTASGGVLKSSGDFSLKNSANLVSNTLMKWDASNLQLTNTLISDNGSTVTIGGDLVVEGTQTIFNTSVLKVEDNIIELRKGTNITAADGGIQVNLTTDVNDAVTGYQSIQWYNSGGYWRSFDGSIDNRFVTETESQILTNKTLTSPTLTAPILGAATATTINGLAITSTASAVLDIASSKTLNVDNDLLLKSTISNGTATIDFRTGGDVAYTSDTLATFAATTATQLRGVISGTTGLDNLVFQTNPTILTGITTTSVGFSLLNSGANNIQFGGSAQQIDIGAAGGVTTINQNLVVNEDLTVGSTIADSITFNGIVNSENSDLFIRGGSGDPMKIGRGNGAVNTNTAVGVRTLNSISSGSQNTAVGFDALLTANSGAANTAVGNRALRACGVGDNNIAIGRDSMLVTLDGSKNIGIGNNTLETNNSGVANICLGHYAGYSVQGDGNVVIGPATNQNSTDQTYSVVGDRNLVIASGTEAWIKGDSSFKVTVPNNFSVIGDTTIGGTLTVNGTLTTINSNVIEVDDKEITLGAVESTTFQATTVSGSNIITSVTPTNGLIPGMIISSTTAGIEFGSDTEIISIDGNTFTLSNSASADGNCGFLSLGASDLSANQGGIRIKGTTDKRIYYDNSRTEKYWVSTENFELQFGKKLVIGNQLVLDTTTLGPTVVDSSLESVGTLTSLDVSGSVTIGGVVTEKVFNNFSTVLTPASNNLTINLAGTNTICGTTSSGSQILKWEFTGVGLSNGQSKTITLVLNANTVATYGDSCSVDGVDINTGVRWSGGSAPDSTSNTDILTFVIIRDNSGVTRVYGQGNTDFS